MAPVADPPPLETSKIGCEWGVFTLIPETIRGRKINKGVVLQRIRSKIFIR